MTRYALGIIALFAVLGCNNPMVDGCACTEKACLEGVTVRLVNNPDSATYSGFSVRIAYSDTVESTSYSWAIFSLSDFHFHSGKLMRQQPRNISVLIDYQKAGEESSLTLDSTIQWTSSVCNHCSGKGMSCKDDMAYKADLAIDLATVLPD